MTDLQQAALILLASSRNASYGPAQAVREAREMLAAIEAVETPVPVEAAAGVAEDSDPGDCR